jgi:hypothetical protein
MASFEQEKRSSSSDPASARARIFALLMRYQRDRISKLSRSQHLPGSSSGVSAVDVSEWS